MANGVAILCMRNHPSSDPAPNREDRECLTKPQMERHTTILWSHTPPAPFLFCAAWIKKLLDANHCICYMVSHDKA
jgi:hypothetical protein